MRFAAGLSLLLLGAVVLVAYRRRRDVLLALAGFTAAFDTLQVGHVHLATVAAVLVAAASVAHGVAWGRRGGVLAVATLAAAALLASSVVFGRLVNSSAIAVQLLLLAASAGLILVSLRPADADKVLLGLLAGVVLQCVIASLQLAQVIDPHYFIDASGISRVHAFYREPDFLGAFSAIGLILAVRLDMRLLFRVVAAAVCGATLLFSFARGAIIALVLSGLALAVGKRLGRGRIRRVNRLAMVMTAIAVIYVGFVDATVRETFTSRAVGAISSDQRDVAVEARIGQLVTLREMAASAPWHGYGLSAGGRVTGFGAVEYGEASNNVATNWILDLWVGGKYLSLPLILILVGLALLSARTVPGQILVLTLINSLVSNVIFLPVTWLAFALAGSAVISQRMSLSRDATMGHSVTPAGTLGTPCV